MLTKFVPSLAGDLGIQMASGTGGKHELVLANPHGDIVTTIIVPATGSVTGITAWADYTEYGGPRDPAATRTVGGPLGYGWLGAKERATPSETYGLTLMGARYYNPTTGRFTSHDPIYGGNANTYTYPVDPINMTDLDGNWGWRKFWRRSATVTGFVAVGACVVATAGLCGVATVAAVGASGGWHYCRKRYGTKKERRRSWGSYGRSWAVDAVTVKYRAVRSFKYIKRLPRHSTRFGRHGHRVRTHSYGWGWRHKRRHTAGWTAVNSYYGYRSYRNGW